MIHLNRLHYGYFFTGQNAVQVLVNDTKRMIHQTCPNKFGADYTDFDLYSYLYGRPPLLLIRQFLEQERVKKEMRTISTDLDMYIKKYNVKVQPLMMDIFNAFQWVNEGNIKVVILGQDPTPKEGEATGMAFSLKETTDPTSVSTGNILRLLKNHGYKVNEGNGDLTRWAKQGVLLLNSALTITVGMNSDSDWHQKLWRTFTIKLIHHLSVNTERNLVWMLWGVKAQAFRRFIDEKSSEWKEKKHLVLEGMHPSPLNGDKFAKQNDFFGEANKFLQYKERGEINWNLA